MLIKDKDTWFTKGQVLYLIKGIHFINSGSWKIYLNKVVYKYDLVDGIFLITRNSKIIKSFDSMFKLTNWIDKNWNKHNLGGKNE